MSRARAAYQRWQAAAGPWQGWTICPALLSPEIEAITPEPPTQETLVSAREIGEVLAAELRRRSTAGEVMGAGWTLVQMDLEPAWGVSIATALSRLGLAAPLLVLPRWPYAAAVLPMETLLSALLAGANEVQLPTASGHVCVVLDADRERPLPQRPADDPRTDNRYKLSPNDLPDLAALRRRGISQLIRVTRGAITASA